MDIKDIESGTSHVANEVLLLLCNDRKWHDSWVDYVAFVKTSDFYDRWPHKAVDLMAVDLFSRMHDAETCAYAQQFVECISGDYVAACRALKALDLELWYSDLFLTLSR